MKTADIYRLAVKILRRVAKEQPSKTFTNKQGDTVSISQVVDVLDRAWQWMYPELSTDDIAMVVRCKHCKYYKQYRKKNDIKSKPFYACSLTSQKRDPMFFCKEGEEE